MPTTKIDTPLISSKSGSENFSEPFFLIKYLYNTEINMTDTTLPENTPPSLTINDIGFLVQIIETVAQRGAFRADELTSVGAVYDRVKAFIVANTQQPVPTEQTTEQTTEEPNQ